MGSSPGAICLQINNVSKNHICSVLSSTAENTSHCNWDHPMPPRELQGSGHSFPVNFRPKSSNCNVFTKKLHFLEGVEQPPPNANQNKPGVGNPTALDYCFMVLMRTLGVWRFTENERKTNAVCACSMDVVGRFTSLRNPLRRCFMFAKILQFGARQIHSQRIGLF